MVKKQDEDGRLNAAICCAPALAFGTWGLLEAKKRLVEIDGKIVTSRGPGTTMEFSVTLFEQLFGKDKAAQVSGPLVMRPNPGDEYTITELNQMNWPFDNTPKGGLGGAEAFASSEKLVNMLKKQAESNKPYGAICASIALVFEPNGLLKGKKATPFPAMCSKLSDQSHIDHRVLADGNLITSRGPGTSLEFALAIVEKFYGRNFSLLRQHLCKLSVR